MADLNATAPLTAAEAALAAEVLATARAMNACGINRGAAGNVSARCPGAVDTVAGDTAGADFAFLITPTGMAYADCEPADMVKVGAGGTASGRRRPSSEWRFHHDIYAARPEAGAVVHTHSPFATALACQGQGIPPFHYMVARFGGRGDDCGVRCADYATFGTQELSDAVIAALEDRCACLMAHHGMLVFGRDPAHALDLAVELETLCEQYWRVLQLGQPRLLPAEEMARVIARFATYGQQTDA